MSQPTTTPSNKPAEETKRPTYKLIKQETGFKLIISDALEEKFRVLLNKFPSTEWSGIMFYSFTGSLAEKNLTFTAEDVFFMDLGSGVYTEFDPNSEDVLEYILDHELFGLEMGLVHSHHTMTTFFSGTDDATLVEEGGLRNHFLSLIVNNAGVYNAYFTERAETVYTIKQKITCRSFGDIEVTREEESEEKSEPVIIAHHCTIDKAHKVCNDYEELMARIEKCVKEKQAKAAAAAKTPFQGGQGGYVPQQGKPATIPFNQAQRELEFPGTESYPVILEGAEAEEEFERPEKNEGEGAPYILDDKSGIGEEEVNHYALQLLSCNYLINHKSNSLKNIAKNIEKYLKSNGFSNENYFLYAEDMFENLIKNELETSLADSDYLAAMAQIHNLLLQECPGNKYAQYFIDKLSKEIENW